ncbi:MAG: SulP family inorganic anion transporter [Dermatophilaceae bacterium]
MSSTRTVAAEGNDGAPAGLLGRVPGFAAVRSYRPQWFGRDVAAGLVLTALLVPQGMAYAELAGLPAVTGLYTSVLCLLGYAVFGPSRILVLGPDSSLGPMIAATILPLVAADGDPGRAVALASMLALFVGLVLVLAGLGHLGLVADLLSKPTQIGYLNGLALTIVVGQLGKLVGFSIDADGLVAEVAGFVTGVRAGEVVPAALAVGLFSLIVILLVQRWLPRVPAVLVAVLTAIAVAAGFDLAARGVSLVGVLPQGFPPFTIPQVSAHEVGLLAVGAVGIALVSLTDTIPTASAFASRTGQEVRADQEMVGIGAANIAAGFFQGFPVSTSGSRTAVAEQAGARSQLAGVVGAGAITAMLLFLPWLLQNLPQPTLAAVVIAAALSLADIRATRRLWRQRRSEWLVSVVAFLGVALLGVLPGIVVAVLLSVFHVFRRSWWPYRTRLGRVEHLAGYHDVTLNQGAQELDGLVLLRFDAPLFFANARGFRDDVRAVTHTDPKPRWIVLAAEPVTDVDPTAADMMLELVADLQQEGVQFVVAELKDPVKAKLRRYELVEDWNESRFLPTVEEAVTAYRREFPDAVWRPSPLAPTAGGERR